MKNREHRANVCEQRTEQPFANRENRAHHCEQDFKEYTAMTRKSVNATEQLRMEQTATARRWFLRDCGVGLGAVALRSLLGESMAQADDPLAPRQPHFAPRAKNVIFLFLAGAPNHLELFDYKPPLAK